MEEFEETFIGREEELEILKLALEQSCAGDGNTVLISGEAGIGKTALVRRFLENADQPIFTGLATSEKVEPFMLFSDVMDTASLLDNQESISFTAIFAIDPSGMLLAQSSGFDESDLDADIFAGMLSAVQSFVRDSFDSSGQQSSGLGRLEYGDMKILIEHGSHVFLTAILSGREHEDMQKALKSTLANIECDHCEILEKWGGSMSMMAPVQAEIDALAGRRFLVRKDLEGMKLENERLRIADEILARVQEMSAEEPIIIYLGDLHWADESSLFVLGYLIRNILSERIMILLTARPADGEPLSSFMEGLRSEDAARILRLEAFSDDDVSSLIDSLFPDNDFPDGFREKIADHCRGNPFFATEVLRQMADEGSIVLEYGRFLLAADEIHIPDAVEDVIQKRLDTLDMDALSMAEYASCIGLSFPVSVASSHPSLPDVPGAIEGLAENGIITGTGDFWEFSHPILHEVIYDSLSDRWKAAFHLNLGRYYEEEHPLDREPMLYELARHYSRSRDFDKGYEYSLKAGRKAESSFAMEQAIDFFRGALDSLFKSRRADSGDLELEVRERLGQLNFVISDYDDALKELELAYALADDGEERARILRSKAEVYERTGDYDRKLEILEEAAAQIEGAESPEFVRILLSQMHIFRRRAQFDEAQEILDRIMGILKEMKEADELWAQVHKAHGLIDWRRGEYDRAIENLERAAALFGKVGNIREVAGSRSNLGSVYIVKGDFEKAKEMYNTGLDIFEKMGDRAMHSVLLNNMGNVYSDTGDMETALDYYFRCLEIRERIGDKRGIGYSLNNIGNIMKFLGRFDEALDYCRRSQKILENIGDRIAIPILTNNIAHIKRYKGDFEGSLELYNRSLDMATETGNRKTEVTTRCDMAEIYIEMGMPDKAREHAEKALEVSLSIGGKLEEGIAWRVLGMVLRLEGDEEGAEADFDKADPIFEAMGDKREVARLDYERGILYKQTGNQDMAAAHLDKALSFFNEQGMEYWSEKTRGELENF